MSKTLIESAKAVLEGAYPEVSPGKISNPNPVDGSTASTANAKTLRPKSAPAEGDPKHNEAEDLGGATPTSLYSDNIGAKASGKNKRDKSVKGSGANAEPAKKLQSVSEDEEIEGDVVAEEDAIASRVARIKAIAEAKKADKDDEDDKDEKKHKEPDGDECMKEEEDFELSEELEDFINEAIEAGLTEEEIIDAIDENFEFLEEDENLDEDTEIEEALEDYQVDMSEHVDALLEGENLSEDFHAKATTIFEAAVKSKLEEEVALLEQAYAETLEERVAQIEEELSTQVDEYLNYVVEQWIEQNEVAVESALRSELTEEFISGLRALFAEHYIDIPEESVDVVEELSQTVEELEEKLNEEIERNVSLTSALNESRKSELVAYVCDGLTDTQQEKLRGLAENVSYEDDDQFIQKISTLRENYFPTTAKNDYVLDNTNVVNDPTALNEESLNGPMATYVKTLGRSLPK